MQQLESAHGPVPDDISARYLQLPDLDPRIPQIAKEVSAHAKTDLERAAAIQTYLSQFRYTLRVTVAESKKIHWRIFFSGAKLAIANTSRRQWR